MTTADHKRSYGVLDLAQFSARSSELRQELDVPTVIGGYVAFTDGACLRNPRGPGGWAAVIDGPEGGDGPTLLWGHLSSTSNNRAEALGVLGALEWVPPGSHLEVHSDSELTVRVLQGSYKAKANPDIWEVIRRTLADKQLKLRTEWVRGHAGHPRNELADHLSKLGATDRRLADPVAIEVEPARAVDRSRLAELEGLTPQGDWERGFLSSIADQLKRGRALSPKQQAVVARIRERRKPD